ncbi:hypothetical protein ES705_45927 [subsurface metagenome]
MRSKILVVVLVISLVLSLVGCGGIVTPATDEAEIKSVIHGYFLAINDQNWSKAKGYCVYGSDRYYATCVLEDAINVLHQLYGSVTITVFVTISNVFVSGSYATAYGKGTMVITYGYYSESGSASATYYLQKIGNNWKIYGP